MYKAKELSNKVIKTINQAGCKKFVVLVDNETELVGTIRGFGCGIKACPCSNEEV